MKRIASMLLVAAALAASPSLVTAQNYPTQAIRIIVPFPPGGLVDTLARLLSSELTTAFDQRIVVDNRPGAGGSIGEGEVARAAPDGYTLLMVLDSFATNPLVYKKLPYDPFKDLAPISLIAKAPMVAIASLKFAPNTLAELIAYAKANPGKVDFGSVGAGSASHLTSELFAKATGISMVHVPYKGGAPAQIDLMAGRLHLFWGTSAYAYPMVQTGKVKVLGQTGAKRSAAFPDLPTATEQGVRNFDALGWIGMLAPAGTPPAIIDRWQAELVKAANKPLIAKRLNEQGFDVVVSKPDEFGKFVRAEHDKWAVLIREQNISLE